MIIFIATVYPGGGIAVLSAFLWLISSVLSLIALGVGFIGYLIKVSRCLVVIKIAMLVSIFAIFFLVLETLAVAWDAFFTLEDVKYFYEQFPANSFRGILNLAIFLLSFAVNRSAKKMNVRAN